MRYGIDVSHENGRINWYSVSRSGVDFAILRCHQRFGIDEQFKRNYAKCQKYGIPIGVYKYSYATTPKEAKTEAKKVLKVLQDKELALPVFYDLEWENQQRLGVEGIQSIAEAFLKKVASAGYQVGIYCNLYWYNTFISDSLKQKYQFWIASYPAEDEGIPKEGIRPEGENVILWQYSERGSVEGISGGVDMNLLKEDAWMPVPSDEPNLVLEPVQEDEAEEPVSAPDPGVSAEDILKIARGWIGCNEAQGTHKPIIDLYNSHEPLAGGYRVQYTDSWCDTFVSAVFIKAGAVDLIGGTECGVERHIALFEKAGIWIEDGSITPQVGDIVTYNWDDSTQPNTGFADHIGIVDAVGDGVFSVIEGNYNGAVGRRTIPVGWGYIRGFARPRYGAGSSADQAQPEEKTIDQLAQEVLAGAWGDGEERRKALEEAGYDYEEIQKAVNALLS